MLVRLDGKAGSVIYLEDLRLLLERLRHGIDDGRGRWSR